MTYKPPHPPNETVEDVRVSLRREHPELTDADLDRILSGPPPRRKRSRPEFDNYGKREALLSVPAPIRPSAIKTAVTKRRRST